LQRQRKKPSFPPDAIALTASGIASHHPRFFAVQPDDSASLSCRNSATPDRSGLRRCRVQFGRLSETLLELRFIEMKSLLRRLPYVYFLILLTCFIYSSVYTVHALRLDYADIPTWDAWRCVHDLDQLCQFDLTPLWRQHNEHRVIGVQLLYWLDLSRLGGHQYLLIGCETVCQLAQLLLWWWLLTQITAIPRSFRLALAAACGILMTTAFHVQAMVIPFLAQWYLTQALVLFALLFLWRAARTTRLAGLVTAIITTVIVTFTTGNGMLLWPVLIGMAVLLRFPRNRIAALVLAAAISITVYFVGYVFVGKGRAILLLTHPFYTAGFMAILLGAPASYISHFLGGVIGLAGMAFTMLGLGVMVRRRKVPDAVSVVTVGFGVFMVASALMVAYGRINPADPTFLKARAVRYAMISLTFWASLVVMIGWFLARLPRGRQWTWHLATAGLTVVILVAVVGRQGDSERAGSVRQAWAAEGALGLETGVQDREALAEVYQDPTFVWTQTPVLRRRRLSAFAAGRQDWIGQPIGKLFAVGPANLCAGSIEVLTGVDNGFRAEGRAYDLQTDRAPKDIVFTNAEGTITGLGATRAGGYPRTWTGPRRPPSDFDWVGYVPAEPSASNLTAYAIVTGEKTACPLGGPQLIPAMPAKSLPPLWLPGDPPPRCANARMQLRNHWFEVTPLTEDPQLLFDLGAGLGRFRTLIIRARFEKLDRIDAFFGKQVDGRGVYGIVPVVNQWVDVCVNISHNPFWKSEHGDTLRFDPVSSAGPGTMADIAGIWGSTEAAPPEWPDVQFYPVPAGEQPQP
jgi:hypothetical protein